jgi:hypothetical protein
MVWESRLTFEEWSLCTASLSDPTCVQSWVCGLFGLKQSCDYVLTSQGRVSCIRYDGRMYTLGRRCRNMCMTSSAIRPRSWRYIHRSNYIDTVVLQERYIQRRRSCSIINQHVSACSRVVQRSCQFAVLALCCRRYSVTRATTCRPSPHADTKS